MVVPTTQRQYYNTTKKVSSLAAYAGAIRQGSEAWGEVFDAQQKLRISTSLDEADNNISAEFARVSPQYDNNPENPEFKQYMDSYRKQQYDIARENVFPMYRGKFDEAVRKKDQQYEIKYTDWKLNQNAKNASENVKKTSKSMVNEAYLAGLSGAPQAFDLARENYNEKKELIRNAAVPVLGARATEAALDELDDKYKEALLAGMLDGNPVSLLQLSEEHKDDFDGKLVTKYKKLAEDKIKRLNVEKLNREILDAANSESNILEMSYNRNLTMQEIQDNMPENASEAFKKMILKINGYSTKDLKPKAPKKEKISPAQQARVYQDLQNEFIYLTSNKDTKLQDFQNFNNKVYAAIEDGYISLNDGKHFINDLSVPTMNKWQEHLKQYGDNPFWGSRYGYDKLQKWIDKEILPKDVVKAKEGDKNYKEAMNRRAVVSAGFYRKYNEYLTDTAKGMGLRDVSELLDLPEKQRTLVFNTAVQKVMTDYAQNRFSSLRDTKANPTYVLQNRAMTQVANNPEDKGQGTKLNETRVLQVRIKDGKYWAKLSDGRTREIDFDTYKKYGGQ